VSKNPGTELRRLVREGTDPETAAHLVLVDSFGDEILADLDAAVFRWLENLVVREARQVEGQETNRRMKRVLGSRGIAPGSPKFAEADRKLRQAVYHTADGARVLWDDMTVAEVRAKIALLRKQVGSLAGHLVILEAACDLMAERAAERLGDIPDWPVLVRKMSEERGVTPSWMYIVGSGEDGTDA
jgi:hypothetical protein